MNGCRPTICGPRAGEREGPALLDLELFEDIRLQLQLLVVADQPGIAVDDHQPGVLVAPDQHADLAAGLARFAARDLDHRGCSGGPARAGVAPRAAASSDGPRRGAHQAPVWIALDFGFGLILT